MHERIRTALDISGSEIEIKRLEALFDLPPKDQTIQLFYSRVIPMPDQTSDPEAWKREHWDESALSCLSVLGRSSNGIGLLIQSFAGIPYRLCEHLATEFPELNCEILIMHEVMHEIRGSFKGGKLSWEGEGIVVDA